MIGHSQNYKIKKDLIMKKSFILGVDISCDKLNLAIKSIITKETINEFEIQNTPKVISAFLTRYILKNKSEFLIIMEATGVYGLELLELTFKKNIDACVLNPLIIKRYSEMEMFRAKTDKFDAKIIAKYGCEKFQELKLAVPKNKKLSEIISILKLIDDYQLSKTELSNRLHSAKKNIYSSKEIVKSLTFHVGLLNKEIDRLTNLSIALTRQYDETYFNKLKNITGVGEKVAMTIIGFFNRFELFETSKQVASFVGINPKPFESGSSVKKKGGISKKGNPYIRKNLYMASLSASKHNIACRELYERLITKGKSKKTALIAVSNKLLRQIFAVVKHNRAWDNNYKSTMSPV